MVVEGHGNGVVRGQELGLRLTALQELRTDVEVARCRQGRRRHQLGHPVLGDGIELEDLTRELGHGRCLGQGRGLVDVGIGGGENVGGGRQSGEVGRRGNSRRSSGWRWHSCRWWRRLGRILELHQAVGASNSKSLLGREARAGLDGARVEHGHDVAVVMEVEGIGLVGVMKK